jgi:predicted PurR-regulated permease PerM
MTILTPEQPAPTSEKREWRMTGVIFFSVLAIGLLFAAFLIIKPFITAILLGAIIVTLSFGTFRRVRTRMKGSSVKAAVIMLLGITLLIVLPAIVVSSLLAQQASTVVENLQSGDARRILQRIDLTSRLQFLKRIAPNFDPATLSPERIILPAVQKIPGWVARNGGAVVGGLAGAVLGFFIVLLSAFYFYVEGESILEQLAILSPLPRKYDEEFKTKFKDVIDATFRGQLFTAVAQGVTTGVGLAIAGVPGSGFWGALTALTSLLPMVGAAAVWVPATIYLFVSASMGNRPYWQAIFMLVWGMVPVSLVDNIVRPWAMKGKAQLPAIPLLFAVLGGLQAFGFIGLVIGPLVFALLMTVIDIYKRSFRLQTPESALA